LKSRASILFRARSPGTVSIPAEWAIDDEALLLFIRRCTREPGVRNLERQLATLIRKAVKEPTPSRKKSVLVEAKNVADYIGVPSSATTRSRTRTTVATGGR
jgi:ATP-dependent Lon protease